jgi:TRAP transporter 4TM/12TM fusion protein
MKVNRLHKLIVSLVNTKYIVTAIAVTMSLFHLYTGIFGSLAALKQRSLHFLFVLVLVFILYPNKKASAKEENIRLYDHVLIILSFLPIIYIFNNYEYISFVRYHFITPLLTVEKVLGALTIFLLLEAARRTVGIFLAVIGAIAVAYVFLGPYLPGILYYPGISLEHFLELQYLTEGGILGAPLGISATYIILFVIFGAFMMQTNFGDFLTDLAIGLTGKTRGGPAKVAVITSAAFGSISGSAAANVAITGTFSIPMMKRAGFRPHFAAAVEAVASTGGQIMPPVMGAVAFLMVQYSGIPYLSIIKHALIPAILYFTTAFFMVDLEAAKNGIKGLKEDELPLWREKLFLNVHMVIPIIILLYLMVIGRTLFFAVTTSIFSTVAASLLRRSTRLSPQDILAALANGAKGALVVAVACGIAGLMIGCIYITGLGVRFSSLVVEIGEVFPLLALVMTMVASLILGLGLPTSAAYVLMVALIIPALIKIGIPVLEAHMFSMYYACLSLVTPPVATASYVAAGIAQSPMMRTGWTSARIAAPSYIVPFMFVYSPALLFVGSAGNIAVAVLTALIGTYAFAIGLQGWWLKNYLNFAQRALSIIIAMLMLYPERLTDLLGFALLALLYFWDKRSSKINI